MKQLAICLKNMILESGIRKLKKRNKYHIFNSNAQCQ